MSNAVHVWAPKARTVRLQSGGAVTRMEPVAYKTSYGWWRADGPAIPGADYAFLLDDGDPLPDPRSPWQPQGVHGASRFYDHSAFPWSDRNWQAPPLSSALIYELHTGTFTPEGTFDGAIARLDHLVELGVTHVELMPVQEFSGGWGWGYDTVDLFAPHHVYGGPDGLKRLIDACHRRGLAVLLDVVYNHLGPSGNYLARFGPYFTDRYSTPWGPAINFDSAGSLEVRRFFCDNALMWLRDYHADGLRLDAIHAIFDSSATHFLAQLAREVKQLAAHVGRELVLIAESDLNDPRVVTPVEMGGFGMDAQWSDDFHHALHTVLTGERSGYYFDFGSLADLAKALTNAFVYDGRYSCYRKREHGAKPVNLSGARFIGYLQTHDQVGNRARGERSSQLMSPGRLQIGAALVLCSPFLPLLFQGEEFAASPPFLYFTQHEDPELARAVSDGRRREFAAFGWDPEKIPNPQDPRTLERSKLDWSELQREPHRAIFDWYRRLIALRREFPELSDGRLDRVLVQFDEREQWMTVRRGTIGIVFNVSKSARRVPLRFAGEVLLSSSIEVKRDSGSVELPPDSVVILREDFAGPEVLRL
ncbi:MAG TPA: malto-oligosyltrehalose trehalohydrolase [Bryobacteraceae bacterium]|nr:malto-oligosyltrehalose trehalohydrolase [Bryobacteraceae bacterium]